MSECFVSTIDDETTTSDRPIPPVTERRFVTVVMT